MADAYDAATPANSDPAQQAAAELRAIKTRLNGQVAQLAAGANITLSSATVGGIKTVTISASGGGGGSATVYNVKAAPYNAAGDNVTNDTAAIQAAIDDAVTNGGTVYFPPGSYYCASGLSVNESGTISDFAPRASLVGDGPAAARLRFGSGSFAGINLQGGPSGVGLHSYQRIEGLYLEKADGLGQSILLNRVAFFTMRNLTIVGWDYGIYAENFLSSQLEACVVRFNRYGMRLDTGASSAPNAITLQSCVIGNNVEYGAWLINGANFSMFGGSVEGNGIGGGGTRFGILCSNTGTEGGVGINLSGVYFENNAGTADVWLTNSANSIAHSIVGCTFNRISNVNFVTHNIYVETATVKQTVLIAGCGFKSYNSYVPSGARLYIHKVDSSGGTTELSWGGCLFEDAVEVPTATNFWSSGGGGSGVSSFNGRSGAVSLTSGDVTGALGYTPAANFGGIAYATVSSAGSLLRGGNISSVTYNGTGDYTVNFAFSIANNSPVATSAVSDIEIFATTASSVRLRTFARASSTPLDAGFALVVF